MIMFFNLIPLKFVSEGPNVIKSALVEGMSWHQIGSKLLPDDHTNVYHPASVNLLIKLQCSDAFAVWHAQKEVLN